MAKQMGDIGLDVTGDLKVVNGDWVVAESADEHQTSLIIEAPGEYKYAPLVGTGAVMYLDDDSDTDFLQEVSRQLAGDGMDVQQVAMQPNQVIEVDAFYK